jgi:hypothetical protein
VIFCFRRSALYSILLLDELPPAPFQWPRLFCSDVWRFGRHSSGAAAEHAARAGAAGSEYQAGTDDFGARAAEYPFGAWSGLTHRK